MGEDTGRCEVHIGSNCGWCMGGSCDIVGIKTRETLFHFSKKNVVIVLSNNHLTLCND